MSTVVAANPANGITACGCRQMPPLQRLSLAVTAAQSPREASIRSPQIADQPWDGPRGLQHGLLIQSAMSVATVTTKLMGIDDQGRLTKGRVEGGGEHRCVGGRVHIQPIGQR